MDNNYNSYNYDIKRRKGTYDSRKRGKKREHRLLACIVIFATAVCFRAVAPELSRDMSGRLLGIIDHSVDYRAAFAAVGSFVSGDSTLEEAIAVFRESETAAEPAAAVLPEPSGAAEYNLQTMYLQCLEAEMERMREAEPVMAAEEGTVTYVPDPVGLPDNVCAELVELPFDYTRPVAGAETSGFGYRDHPIDNVNKFHYGTDFMAAEGEDIYAFADGHVAASGISETAGKYLIISHGNGWTTQYFHCSEVYAKGGSRVTRGQVVAAAGHTGAATGPHLHFELICDGVYHDPGLYLNEQG